MFGNNKPFGTASAFGGTGGTTTFGAKPATGNVFGTSTFGTTTPASGGLFGNPAPTTATGLFGQTSTAFGQPASTSGGSFAFGNTSTSGGLFGTTTPATQSSGLFGSSSTSAFGSPRPAFGGFGTTNTGAGLFGQSTSTGTGLFGSTTGFSITPTNGTTVKFNPPTGQDTMMKGGVTQSINTRHQCITCMKEYENKSLEELRLEDYAANRKGAQTGIVGFGTPAANTGGLFGTPAASTSGFSFGTTQSKPLFGTTSGTNTFGTPGTSLFGQTSQPQSTGIFGKPVGFGTATTSAAPAFSFGNTTGSSLFGQNNQQKPLFGQPTGGTGLFGQSTTTQPTTGFTTGTGFGGFGATSQPSTGLFGAKPTGFGTTSTATTNTFSFGNPTANTGGLFGQKPAAPAFGTSTGFGTGNTFGSFGTTQTTNTGLFGQNKPAGTGFGTTGTGFGSTLGSGFGTSPFTTMGMSTNTGTGLFGSSLTNKQPGFSFGGTGNTGFGFGQPSGTAPNFSFGSNPTPAVGSDPNSVNLLQQQLQAQQVFAFTANPFGDNPLFRNSIKDSKRREELLKPTNPAAQKAVLTNNRYKVSPLPATKIKPKPLTPISSGKVSLFDGLEDEEPSLGNTSFVPKRSVKKLVMKSQNNSPLFTVMSSVSSGPNNPTEITVSTSVRIRKTPTKDIGSVGDTSLHSSPLTVDISDQSPLCKSIELTNGGGSPNDISFQGSPYVKRLPFDTSVKVSPKQDLNDTIEALHTRPVLKAPVQSPDVSSGADGKHGDPDTSLEVSPRNEDGVSATSEKPHPTGIRLTKQGYYTIPSLDELVSQVDEDGNCFVTNFVIGREGYGSVSFLGKMNVANLNLDELVIFRHKEITVYPDDDKKPPVGEELNRKAEVTLECVWPTDKTSHTPVKDPMRLSLMGYIDKIKKSTSRLGAKFIDYKPETGSWVFEVEHFSKYGLEDSDDECDDPKLAQGTKAPDPSKKAPPDGERYDKTTSQTQLTKKLRSSAVDDDDEMQDADIIAQERENIFSPLQQLVTAGVESERIQGMKASFFLNEVEDSWENEVEMQEPIPHFGSVKTRGHFLKPVPIKKTAVKTADSGYGEKSFFMDTSNAPTVSYTSVPNYVKQNAKASSSITAVREEIWSAFPVISPLTLAHTPTAYHKTLTGAGRKISLRPFSQSSVFDKQRYLADMGYFMGRRFRVGWGPGFKLLHLGQVEANFEPEEDTMECSVFSSLSRKKSSLEYNPFTVSISEVNVLLDINVDQTIKRNLVQSLEVQHENSESTIEDGVPIFVPKPGIGTQHAHANISEEQLYNIDSSHNDGAFVKQCTHVWELCVALWGELPGLASNQNVSAYVEQMARREALSNWLIKTTKEKVLSEINNNSFDPSSYLSVIFSHLTARQISKAVCLAQESNDHCLATLLAQAEGNEIVRRLISKQLLNWERSGACSHITYQRLKLYALLAGAMIWRTDQQIINCCESIDWRRTVALHLWYNCFPTAGIQDAIQNFEKSFMNPDDPSSCYSHPPFPPYMQCMENLNNSTACIYDTCFHLLKLYCDRSYRLDKLLMPETYTPAHTDYRLSWLLHQSLQALGYCHLPSDAAYALHLNFSSQLEAMGLWQWAVFVVLHLPNPQVRAKYVKDLLLRHLSLERSDENEDQELFLQEKLLVPAEWIYEAKAIKAHSFGQPADEAWFLLKAGFWSKSHEIIISQLASDAIINENYEYLLNFLKELAPTERSKTILDWASGGQVFLDYIHISQMVNNVVKGEVSAYDVEKLQPEVMSLCHRLSSLQCHSAKDRLCQSEMSKKTATLLRAVCILQAEKSGGSFSAYTLSPHIKSLPMPEDYALQELRALARSYLPAAAAE